MKKKTFLVFILFLTWLNYLLSYEYVKNDKKIKIFYIIMLNKYK